MSMLKFVNCFVAILAICAMLMIAKLKGFLMEKSPSLKYAVLHGLLLTPGTCKT